MRDKTNRIDKMLMRGQINAKSAVKAVFGGSDDSAQRGQARQNKAAAALAAQRAKEARADVSSLFPAADINRNLGIQGALDVIGQGVPQQLSAFQQGNVGAQQQLLAGLPQIQNALLGRPVDLSGLQAQTLPIDASFSQQQLPQFISSTSALSPEAQEPVTPTPEILAMLRGLNI